MRVTPSVGWPGCFHHDSRSRQVDGRIHGLGACHISSSCAMALWDRGTCRIVPSQAIENKNMELGGAVEQTSRVGSGHARVFSNLVNDSTVDIVTSGGLPKTVILRGLRWNGPPRRIPQIMHGRSAAVFSLLARSLALVCRKGEHWGRALGTGIAAVWRVRLAGAIAFDTLIAYSRISSPAN